MSGTDEGHGHFLKELRNLAKCESFTALFLTPHEIAALIHKFYEFKNISSEWKKEMITKFHKKGSSRECNILRGAYLFPSVKKIIVYYPETYQYRKRGNRFPLSPNRSTLPNLLLNILCIVVTSCFFLWKWYCWLVQEVLCADKENVAYLVIFTSDFPIGH